jgi:stress response protein SCP2
MKVFTRGQRSRLDALTSSSQLTVGLSIAAPSHVVLDYGCFGVDQSNFLADERYFVFYNQPRAPDDSIALLGAGAGDNERFAVNLEALPAGVRRLVFTATIDGTGTMMQIARGHLRVLAGADEIVRYEFSGADFHSEQALLVAEIYWKDTWRFGAIGQGFAGDLRTLLHHFGGVEAEASQSPPVVAGAQAPPQAPPQAPLQSPPPPASPPVPLVSSTASPPPAFPIAPGAGESLQSLVDAAPAGSTLALLRGEYQGPLVINKPLHLDGRNAVIWAHQGPVVTVAAPGVILRDMEIEVTVPEEAQDDGDIALLAREQSAPQLQNVVVRGRLSGLGAGEDGDWKLPATLDLGAFAPRGENRFLVRLAVPVACRLSSAVAGLTCSPDELSPGEHDVELRVQGIGADTLIAGRLEVRSAQAVRAIALTGGTVGGSEPVDGKRLL